MDYKVFEARCLELFFKTGDQVTPQVAAYRIGIPVDDARAMLESMATREVVSMESDDNGVIYFDLPNRPPPSGEPLSWQVPQAGHPMMMVPVRPMMPGVPVVPMMIEQEKSMAGSILLSFFFGPFGMFYSTIPGAVVMLTAGTAFVAATMGIGLLVTWPGCILWSALATNARNNRVRHQRNTIQANQQYYLQQQHAQYMAHQRGLPTGNRPTGR